MKIQKLSMMLIGVLLLAGAVVSASAQTDLNTRKAVYFTGAKTNAIDLSKDVYASGGSTIHISAELRTSCNNNVCEFNVGVIATKTGSGAAATSVSLAAHGETFTKSFTFGASETSKQIIFPVKLKLGKNNIAVKIDPANQITETNENNNGFSTTVMVSWKQDNPDNKN